MTSPEVSLLTPAKNERDNLPRLFAEISEAMEQQERSWELLVVDDGSTDDSWQVITELAARDPRIRGIRLRRNFGKAAALAAGVAEARGELLRALDACGNEAERAGLRRLLDGTTDTSG